MRPAAALALLGLAFLGCSEPPAPSPSSSSSPAAASASSSSSPAASSSAAKPGPVVGGERWGGVMLAGPSNPIQIEVVLAPGDKPTGTISIPAQKVENQPLEDVQYTAKKMSFRMAIPRVPPPLQPTFELDRTDDGKVAKGTIQQQSVTMKVRFRRLAEGEHAGDRPQTPKPPYPYDERAAYFDSKDGTHLAGTLSLPKTGGPFPTVVLVSGTGPQDRDSNLFGHQPFKVIADRLARSGVAVLRVDDRGVGESKGDTTTANEDDKAGDIVAAMNWLATQPDVDPKRIGLLGHSEGGVLVAMAAAAAKSPKAAFVVLFASPGLPGSDLLRTQMRLKLEADGATKEQIEIMMKAQNDAIDAVLKDASNAELEKIVTTQIDGLLGLLPPQERKKVTDADRAERIKGGLVQITAPAMKAFIKSKPATSLEKVKCPVLALGGTKDLQVPAAENLGAIEAALKKAGNKDVTTEAFDGLNHLFQNADTGTMEEWAILDETIDPRVLDKLAAWIPEHSKAGAPP